MEGSFLWTVGSTHKREQGNERKESLGQAKVRRYEIAYDVHKIRFCKATTGESQRRPHFCALAWNRKTSSIASAPISDSSAVWRWTQRETQIKPRENKWKRAEISHLTGTSSGRGANIGPISNSHRLSRHCLEAIWQQSSFCWGFAGDPGRSVSGREWGSTRPSCFTSPGSHIPRVRRRSVELPFVTSGLVSCGKTNIRWSRKLRGR